MKVKQAVLIMAAPLVLSLTSGCGNSVGNPVGPELTFEKKLPNKSSKEPRVAVCHLDDSGAYRQITVNGNAM